MAGDNRQASIVYVCEKCGARFARIVGKIAKLIKCPHCGGPMRQAIAL